ncbi:hypothetical protein DFH07DRAFT_963644 [Mycena maculata]|uniref:Uncharacterized protein n=1 Tax=Mycena maculata TaxID=230809 RepID=A0AAD7IMH2_9AGAR|nr:hypothetical protein DFH07DRAFT_963644 [Mycena maculata]
MDLLRNRDPTKALGPFDGKVVALAKLRGETYFITTNQDYVPALPSLELPHAVFLRPDMCHGTDDPTLWPQQYTTRFCHLPVIAKKGARSELNVMWWDPAPEDFVVGSAVTHALGRVHNQQLKRNTPTPISPLFGELIQNILMWIEQLQTLPTTYPKMVFAVTSLQRACLELDVLYYYVTHFKPRIDNYLSSPPDSPYSNFDPIAACMGAFTVDPGVAQQLWSARLPFWFLRPTHVFDSENILSVVELEEPTFNVTVGDGAPPVVYTTNTTEEKIAAIHSASSHTPWYRDPFQIVDSEPPLSSPPASQATTATFKAKPIASTSAPVARSKSKKPCPTPYPSSSPRKAQARGPAKTERDKFKSLDILEMPPSITSWAHALAWVDKAVTPFTENPADRRYIFPEPALLVNTTPEWQCKFLHHWMLLCDGFTYMLSQPLKSQLLHAQEWRDILEGRMTKRGHPESKTGRQSALLEDRIQPALDACNLTSLEGFPVPPESLPEFSLAQTREIVWQVAETSFRFEFCGLDRRASQKSRVDEVLGCFSGRMLIGTPLEFSQRGFAAEKIDQHHRYFMRAATLMLDWNTRSPRPPLITRGFLKRPNWNTTQMEGLEAAVCQYYTQAFWEYFGRAAVVPLRLDHDVEKSE